mmetsp:Transcript_15962/g.27147  ORF Transcript_15962/g.27147 Transcript_15962/m.27147 type:complete len:551 (+) Transcript_15962:65-1717(+)
MSSFTYEGEAWADSWLQQSFTISRIISDAEVARLDGPLTSHLTPESFSSRVVEFDAPVLICIATLYATLCAHEIYAVYRKPLLADHTQANSIWMQMVFLLSWFNAFFIASMSVPVSLDFCLQLGQSATMSGFYLSCSVFGTIVGIIIGKVMTSEADFNPRRIRRIFILSNLASALCTMSTALVMNHAVKHSLAQRHIIFWVVIGLMQVTSVVASIPTVPMLVCQARITPNSEKTFWMIMAQCARGFGLLLGPGFFAMVAFAVKRGHDVSPTSLLAWVNCCFMLMGLFMMNYASMVFPTELVPLPEEPISPEAKVCLTQLPSTQRERIVKNMVIYSIERPFSIAAIEVGTIMLLEVSYGWSTELCGTAFTVVAAASLVFSAICSILMSRNIVAESTIFFAANVVGLFGVLFLFDFGTGAAGLLIADALVYGMASVANGIAEGWGTQAAMPNTSFSVEAYRLQNTIAVNSARFVSPIVARTLLDFGGRNTYAAMQTLFVFLGTVTVYRTVRLVWDYEGQGQGDVKATLEKPQKDGSLDNDNSANADSNEQSQ